MNLTEHWFSLMLILLMLRQNILDLHNDTVDPTAHGFVMWKRNHLHPDFLEVVFFKCLFQVPQNQISETH